MEGKFEHSTCLENNLGEKQHKTRQCSHMVVEESSSSQLVPNGDKKQSGKILEM